MATPSPEGTPSGLGARIRAFFEPPPYADPIAAERATILHPIVSVLLVAAILLAVASPLQSSFALRSALAVYVPLISIFLVSRALVRRGHLTLGAWFTCGFLFLVNTGVVWFLGGVTGQATLTYLTVSVIAGFVLGGAEGLGFAVASSVVTYWMARADLAHRLPTPIQRQGPSEAWVALTANLFVITSVTFLALRSLHTALTSMRRARDAEARSARELLRAQSSMEEQARGGVELAHLGEALAREQPLHAWCTSAAQALVAGLQASRAVLFDLESGQPSVLAAAPDVGPLAEPETRAALGELVGPHSIVELGADGVRRLAASIPGRRGVRGVLFVELGAQGIGDDGRRFVQTLATLTGAALDRDEAELRVRNAQKMEAVGRLAGSVAHDFNNLLTSILGSAVLAIDVVPGDGEARELLDDVIAAGERAALLTRQLLTFSRQQVAMAEHLDVGETIRSMARLLPRLVGEQVRLAVEIEDQPMPVLGDPGAIEQVLLNLAVNARDAMPEGGTLSLQVARADHAGRPLVRLRVVDTGVGMPPEVLRNAFAAFYTTKSHGTGLGLSTVRELVEAMGGTVRVSSREREGTAFEIDLPLEEKGAAVLDAAAVEAPRGSGARILLVDDSDFVRKAIARALAALGYGVVTATGGTEALAQLRAQSFDLLLTDVVMPGMNGLALAREVRAGWPRLPIVMMSGFADQSLGEVAEFGRLLQKPVTLPQLAVAVRAGLDAGSLVPGEHGADRHVGELR